MSEKPSTSQASSSSSSVVSSSSSSSSSTSSSVAPHAPSYASVAAIKPQTSHAPLNALNHLSSNAPVSSYGSHQRKGSRSSNKNLVFA
jgi:hypothetical protein